MSFNKSYSYNHLGFQLYDDLQYLYGIHFCEGSYYDFKVMRFTYIDWATTLKWFIFTSLNNNI